MSYKKIKKFIVVIAAMVTILASAVPIASATNFNGSGGAGGGSGSGNKAMNFNGYKFTNASRNSLIIYFDKTLSSTQLDVSQFKIKEHSSATTVSVTSKTLQTGTGYSGVADSQLDNGSTVTLTLASNLSYDTQYDITLSPTIAANNGITLGNYNFHQDFTFLIKTPDSSGSYTGTPAVTFLPVNSAADVAWEGNIITVIDRPITNVSTVLSSLSTNFKKDISGTLTTVVQDSSIDGTAVSGAEAYTPHANDEHNTLFFPLTGKGNANIAYNLSASSNSYALTLPNFTDVSSNSYSSGGSASFTTTSSDVAAWTDYTPTASVSGVTLTIIWQDNSNSSITPLPSGYNIYYSTTKFGLDGSWFYLDSVTGTSPYTYTTTGSPAGTYYYRVVPTDANGNEVGYSLPTVNAVTK